VSRRDAAPAGAVVLVVEDRDALRTMLRLALEAHGHAVVEARDQPDAERMLAREQPDVVITDLRLPAGDGLGVLRAVKVCRRRVDGDLARFEREAAALARLPVHPALVGVHDAGRDGEAAWLAMDLVEGEPLSRRLDRGPLPAAEVAALVGDCVRRYGRIDVLHNNVGIGGGDADPTRVTEEAWDRILGVNLKSVVFPCKHVLR